MEAALIAAGATLVFVGVPILIGKMIALGKTPAEQAAEDAAQWEWVQEEARKRGK